MKLFQIEEPDGSPADADAPGVAIGIDATGAQAAVAVAVGGNAVVLSDREGFALDLPVPAPDASGENWRHLFEGARLRAERTLARPATHAVIAIAQPQDAAFSDRLHATAEAAGLVLLRILDRDELGVAEPAVLAAAVLAEDLAPRPPGQ